MRHKSEQGNLFVIILLGVILFAALAVTFSRGMQGTNVSKISKKQAGLYVEELLDYALKVERGVHRLLRKGVSESDISFHSDRWEHNDYEHASAQPDEHKVFHPDGGGVTWRPVPDWSTGTEWEYIGGSGIADIGTDGGASGKELMMRIAVPLEVCLAVNERFDVQNPDGAPPEDATMNSTKYKGIFTLDADYDAPEIDGKRTACAYDSSPVHKYYFFHVLVER